MIVPTNRLLFWLTLLLPFAALAGTYPAAAAVAATLFGALAALSVTDAILARGITRTVTIDLPEIVRLSKDRPCTIPISISSRTTDDKPATLPQLLRIGLPLPRSFRSEYDALDIRLTGTSTRYSAGWQCTPAARGRFQLGLLRFETRSPLGLWLSRAWSQCKTELRVYPNLMTERKNLAAVFLRRGQFGSHAQRQVGQGRDFEKLREYLPGDSFDDIHWKATARRGKPITKLFQIERTQQVYVAIDSSRLSAAPLRNEQILEQYMAAGLVLGLVAQQQGDLFGLLTFSDKVKRFVRAANGKTHFDTCRDALYTLDSEIVTPDYNELFVFIRRTIRRRALIIVLTDLADATLAENFARNVDVVCRRHVILVSMLKREHADELFSKPDMTPGDSLHERLGGHMMWTKLRELDKNLQRKGVGFSLSEHGKLSAQLVTEYMSVKARQRL